MSDHANDRPLVGPVDEPPKGGVFRDWDGAQLGVELVAEGNALGETIDPDNDDDNGGVE